MPITAVDVMTATPIVGSPSTTMAELASLLAGNRISAIPICAADATFLGIVSESDLLKPFRESVRQRRDWWLGVLAQGEELPPDFLDYVRTDARTAGDVMDRHVITAKEDMTLPQLAELLVTHGIKRLPVLRDGKLVGIVSRSDLVKAIARPMCKPA